MSIQPEGESLRRAVRWISGQLHDTPERPLMALVHDATLRFDLTPRESEYLIGFYRGAKREGDAEGEGPQS